MTAEIPFKAYLIATAAGGEIETDQAWTDTATRTLTLPSWVKSGKITRISYYIDVTGAVTYTLFVLEGANADNNIQGAKIVYASAAARADATRYDDYEQRAFILDTAGSMYYIVDYTGAPGNTTGYIVVEGVAFV